MTGGMKGKVNSAKIRMMKEPIRKGEGGENVMRTEMRNSGRHVGRKVEEECTDKKKTTFSSYTV